MRTGLLIGVGAILVVAGVVWTLQGLGYVGGSGMIGETPWAVIGPITAVAGVALAAAGLRGRRPAP